MALVWRPALRLLPSSRCSSLVCNRQYQSSTPGTAPEKAGNVHSIVELAGKVREFDAKAGKKIVQRIPTRLTTRSWADEAKARANRGTISSSSTTSTSMHIDSELEEQLKQPKRMMDSYVELTLPFKDMPELLEKYIATSAGIRLGKVFEDLDNLAGDISYTHVLGERPKQSDQRRNPVFIVTASVDRLDLLEPMRADMNYRLSGMVIYVGTSSMEVLVTVEELSKDKDENVSKMCLTGQFTMATRNALTGKSQSIPPLNLSSKAEEDLFAIGQEHKRRKAMEAQTSLQKVPPTSEEAALLHHLFLSEQESTSSDSVNIADTALYNTAHMHPQQRNGETKRDDVFHRVEKLLNIAFWFFLSSNSTHEVSCFLFHHSETIIVTMYLQRLWRHPDQKLL